MKYIDKLTEDKLKRFTMCIVNLPNADAFKIAVDDLTELGYHWSDGTNFRKSNYTLYPGANDADCCLFIYPQDKSAYLSWIKPIAKKNNSVVDYAYTYGAIDKYKQSEGDR